GTQGFVERLKRSQIQAANLGKQWSSRFKKPGDQPASRLSWLIRRKWQTANSLKTSCADLP
ncbi:hypothetical protein AB3X96_40355, partial [Paraburkholderia sp. BR13439]|uniref:hypothetical protein n=1 Tax=Paraburkholderia sp. BR13439 TaxID=3236996 RepID=UPI0034CF2F06